MAKEKKIVKSEKKEVTIGEAVPGIYPRLMDKYKNDVIPALMKEFKYKNAMAVPKLDKIAINSGVGVATQDAKILEIKIKELEAITGQKVVTTKSKKAISNFKLRENMAIGAKVTLRGKKMYEFLDRLINVAIPQIRDFRGVSNKSFDGFGNYTMGIKEQIIFREIDPDKTNRISGMDITFVTTAKSDNEAKELLKNFGMPFIKQ